MNTLVIIIGVTGSGKTTLAKNISPDHWYEADTYPNLYRNGIINTSLLSEAHHTCQNRVEKAMKQNVSTIVQSNTNLDIGEKGILPYIRLAATYLYTIRFVLPGYGLMHYPHYGNHKKQVNHLYKVRSTQERNVPPPIIDRMIQQFYSILVRIQRLSSMSPHEMLMNLS